MNARHAHELVRLKFPAFAASAHEWKIVAYGDAKDYERILKFLQDSFDEVEVVVRVNRKIGGMFPLQEAAELIAQHFTTAEARVANRGFTRFAVVGTPGVATAWSHVP
jgi:hypothetical protein